jgi:hypothetical protein
LFVAAGVVGSRAADKCDPNERFVTDAGGKRYLELRWPLKTSENLVKLRVPAEYVSWADTGCLSVAWPGYPDPNYTLPYASGFSVAISLPDFEPRWRSDPQKFERGLHWSSVDIQIQVQRSTR